MNESAAVLAVLGLTAIGAVLILRRRDDGASGQAAPENLSIVDLMRQPGDGDAWNPDDAWSPDPVYEDTVQEQTPGLIDTAIVQAATAADFFSEAVGFSTPVSEASAAMNRKAFLDMIAYSEGTSGPDGYRTMFGGGLMDSLADHPARFFDFTDKAGRKLKTSAAGRYQFLLRTWREIAAKLNLTDFGPDNQDAAALELIRQRGALKDIDAGRISEAIRKCAPVWASLPGAGYAQPERPLKNLLASYSNAGGNLEA